MKKASAASRSLKGLHLHFDPLSGIAGDMTVAALVDAGVPPAEVITAIAAMKIPGLQVKFERARRGAFAGTRFVVTWPGMPRPGAEHHHHHHHHHHDDHDHDHHHEDDHDHHHHHHDHRDYAEIRRLLKNASLPRDVTALASEIFDRIATVEAKLHGVSIDRVAFHEVGAYDSIADIVGAAAAIAWLEPSAITSTAPVLGTGSVRTAHGPVAVPAPATAALLRGLPVRSEGEGELTTPTGAAILAATVDRFTPPPPVRLEAQGFGAGTRELADRPNVLRVVLGEPLGRPLAEAAPLVTLLQANIDDMSPQLVEPLMSALFTAGAVDVWVTSILMKKGRPAIEVSALTPPEAREAVVRAFFAHSPTLGVRRSEMARTVLARSEASVKTRFGPVAVKVAAFDGLPLAVAPEFEDVKRLAVRASVPVREVLAEATSAAAELRRSPRTPATPPAPRPKRKTTAKSPRKPARNG